MNTGILRFGLGISLILMLFSCDEYIRTEVVKEIYVNKSIVNGFVGDEIQLLASPTDGSYQFQWSSEDPKIATVSNDGKVKLIGEGFTNIVINAGEISSKVEIYSLIRIPLLDISLSDELVELVPNATKTINTQLVPDNANDVPEAIWSSENNNIATVNEKGQIAGVAEGETYVRYTVGDIIKKVKVSVSFTRPFNGPHILKAGAEKIIMAADFDFGGLGWAFNDNAGNPIGNDNYRKGKGDSGSFPVEIEGDGNNIGYVSQGDWYQYTVDVQDAGIYLFDASLSANGNGKYHIEVDGANVTGDIDVPSNGSWSSWLYNPGTPKQINLTQGSRKIKFVTDQSGFNLRALRFRKLD